MAETKVYRDKLKEPREGYFVEYQPADCRFTFALVNLSFVEQKPDLQTVLVAIEREFTHWLDRFPVPSMVSAFNVLDDHIAVNPQGGQSNLMGYKDVKDGTLVKKWDFLENQEIEIQGAPDRLEAVYQGLPFRKQSDVHAEVKRKYKGIARGTKIILFLTLGVPILIEVISAFTPLGYLVSAISVGAGLFKAGKAIGWIKPSKKEKEASAKDLEMKHYYFHCSRNPNGFNKLKFENNDRELAERNKKELSDLSRREKGPNA